MSVEEPASEVQLPVHVADVDQFEVFSVEDESSFDESEGSSEYWIESDYFSEEETDLNILRSNSSSANKRRRGPYTGKSVRTAYRKKAFIRQIKSSNHDIRSFFQPCSQISAPSSELLPSNEELSLHEESSSDHDQSVDDQTVGPVLEHTSESARKSIIPVGQEDLELIQATIKDRQNLPNFGDQLLLLRAIGHYWRSIVRHGRTRLQASIAAAFHVLDRCKQLLISFS